MAIVELENVPVMLAAFRAVKIWPTAGVKALTRAAVSVPPKLAAPVTCSWLYCVPTVVPPTETFMAPVESCE